MQQLAAAVKDFFAKTHPNRNPNPMRLCLVPQLTNKVKNFLTPSRNFFVTNRKISDKTIDGYSLKLGKYPG